MIRDLLAPVVTVVLVSLLFAGAECAAPTHAPAEARCNHGGCVGSCAWSVDCHAVDCACIDGRCVRFSHEAE